MRKKEAQSMVRLLKDNPSIQAVWLGNRKITRYDEFYDYEVPFEWLCDECGGDMVYVGDTVDNNHAVACADGNVWNYEHDEDEPSCSASIYNDNDKEDIVYEYIDWRAESWLYLGKFENLGSTVAKQVAEELEENLECIKKEEPVKNDLIWFHNLLEAEGKC
tara:strand:+ start:58 stop:543 length:486 start_codon:yes stop_codon:yes gene_type:complete